MLTRTLVHTAETENDPVLNNKMSCGEVLKTKMVASGTKPQIPTDGCKGLWVAGWVGEWTGG